MNRVIIPSDFFYNEARQEYYDVSSRLVAELIQNSYDAGAKNIHLNFTDTHYECIDDGCGMDEQTLVNAMLTLGGSQKKSGATGGFGAAKKLILFAHKNYEVKTRNCHVLGEVLDYTMDHCEYYAGTYIRCEFGGAFGSLAMDARIFLKKCKLNANVYINGELFTEYLSAPECQHELGSYSFNNTEYTNVIVNGLFMFSSWTSKGINLFITGNSKEILLQSRDAFAGEYRDKFSALTKSLQTESMSFGKKYVKSVLKGFDRFYILKMLDGAGDITDLLKLVNTRLVQQGSPIMNSIQEAVNSHPNEVARVLNIPVDFHFIGEWEEKHHPVNGLKKYKMLARLYKVIIEEIAKARKDTIEFAVGFTTDSEGAYSDNVFYINPKFAELPRRERYWKVLSIAIHEYVHWLGHNYHDERFASALTSMMELIGDMGGMVKAYEAAKSGLN